MSTWLSVGGGCCWHHHHHHHQHLHQQHLHHHRHQYDSGSTTASEDNMYWDEISALCVDGESLRLQQLLLRKAEYALKARKFKNQAVKAKHKASVSVLKERVRMLEM
jgi:hypothetical protein